jgi:hypothetical protein
MAIPATSKAVKSQLAEPLTPAWRAWHVVPISEKILIRMIEPEDKLWETKDELGKAG